MKLFNHLNPSLGYHPHAWQNECFTEVLTNNKKNQIVVAITGSGKSLVQYGLINYHFKKDVFSINLIATESIALTQQFVVDYVKGHHNLNDVKIVCFNSSTIEKQDYRYEYIKKEFGYTKEEFHNLPMDQQQEIETFIDDESNQNEAEFQAMLKVNDIKSFTDVDKINEIVNECRKNSQPLMVVSTYHSLEKLTHLDFGIITLDEVHTTVSSDRILVLNKLKYKMRVGFTATPVGVLNGHTGLYKRDDITGELVFGSITYEYGYVRAVNDGIIVPITYSILNNREFEGNQIDKGKTHDAVAKYCKRIILTENSDHVSGLMKAKPSIVINVDDISQANYVFDDLCLDSEIPQFDIYNVNSKQITFYDHKSKTKRNFTNKLEVIKHMKSNTNKYVVINIYMLNVGVDVPGFTALGCVSASKEVRLLQSIGRVLRMHADDRGKKWSLDDPDSYKNVTKPYGTFYVFNAGSKRDRNSEIINKAFNFIRGIFGILYFKEKGHVNTQKQEIIEVESSGNVDMLMCDEEFTLNDYEKNLMVDSDEHEFDYVDILTESYARKFQFSF